MPIKRKSNTQLLFNGILTENPIFRLALSMCPAVGISTTVMNGLLLGIAVLFVQVFSSCTIAAIKNYIHPRIRIPTYTLTIATWVTVIDLVLAAYMPEAYKAMGSLEFAKKLLAEAKVAVSPGIGFGEYGEGFVRFSLVENEHRIRQAVRGIGGILK